MLVVEGFNLDTVGRFGERNKKKIKPDMNSGSKKESKCDSLSNARWGRKVQNESFRKFHFKSYQR